MPISWMEPEKQNGENGRKQKIRLVVYGNRF
jgi:hypothetical protein